MKLKFKQQKFQRDATKAVTDVFFGQRFSDGFKYKIDPGKGGVIDFSEGIRNEPIMVDADTITDNIRKIQFEQDLKPTETTQNISDLALTVEMETGTGKTYTYIKTMYELNKLYGWSKFIIVVPSVAIREGVCKSFEIMKDHFAEMYGKRVQHFVYNSKQPTVLDQFASDTNLHVMIINTQAFNARGEDARRIYMRLDSFRSRRPIDVIAATRPILIIDEPQSVLGTNKGNATRERLKEFNPLFTLLYSATHRKDDIRNMVYRLDAIDAYNKKLVKQINVKGISIVGSTATSGYIYLEKIVVAKGKNPLARIGFDVKTHNGTKQVFRLVNEKDNLFDLSDGLKEYENGFRVERIDGVSGTVTFLNGTVIREGEAVGRVNEDLVRRIQIRETIASHLERELALFKKGIKVLSLFFIDHVDNYRLYENGGTQNGKFAEIFEEEYLNVLHQLQPTFGDEEYMRYLGRIDVARTHQGYFSRDKKGNFVNSKLERGTTDSADVDAYNLIMKNKERLLNFDEPVRFIFSHSALKEGWDNPNVFQICTLKDSNNETKKRQEVGRGMRLCVNKYGERQDEDVLGSHVFDTNVLTIVASESYDAFATALQHEIAEVVSDRPVIVTPTLFVGHTLAFPDGRDVEIKEQKAVEIHWELIAHGYIDKKGKLTQKYFDDKKGNTLDFGELNEVKDSIVHVLDKVFDPSSIKPTNARETREATFDQGKFEKKEFQSLWKRINTQTFYTVDFDTEELIKNAIKEIDEHLSVTEIRILVQGGTLDEIRDKEQLESATAMTSGKVRTIHVTEVVGDNVKYDLIGDLVAATQLTRKAVVEILSGIKPTTFHQFKMNPEEFIVKVGNIINEQKALSVIQHIAYHKLDKTYDSDIFTEATIKGKLGVNAIESAKSLYDLVVVDSVGIEKKFAEELEKTDEVVVYTKLPNGFYINTPVGHYNPDWAIAFREGTVKHIYFVAETKGSLSSGQLRGTEKAKIECARRHFAAISDCKIQYGVASDYQTLYNLVTK